MTSAPLGGSLAASCPPTYRSAFDTAPPGNQQCCRPVSCQVDVIDLRKELHIGARAPPTLDYICEAPTPRSS